MTNHLKFLTPMIPIQEIPTPHPHLDLKSRPYIAQGIGFGGNTKTGKYHYGTDYPALKIVRKADGTCTMQNKEVLIINMNHQYKALKRPITFTCLKTPTEQYSTGALADGYDEFNKAYSPSNDALYAGTIIQSLYKEWYRIPVLTKKDGQTPMQVVIRVHYGTNYELAYWDGKQITLGDGGEHLYPLVSLGIIAHEVSHGFTQQHSNLIFFGEAGGINEAFSDMAATAAKYYATGQQDWIIGNEVIKDGQIPQALQYHQMRYMDKPSKDGTSYDTATAYYKAARKDPAKIPIYAISGVYNRLFYILANRPLWDIHKAFDVMVTANRYYWKPYDTFISAACGLIKAAKDLDYRIEDVKYALFEVQIDYSTCL